MEPILKDQFGLEKTVLVDQMQILEKELRFVGVIKLEPQVKSRIQY